MLRIHHTLGVLMCLIASTLFAADKPEAPTPTAPGVTKGANVDFVVPALKTKDPITGKLTGVEQPTDYQIVILVSNDQKKWWDKTHDYPDGKPQPVVRGIPIKSDGTFTITGWVSDPHDLTVSYIGLWVVPKTFDVSWSHFQVEGAAVPDKLAKAAIVVKIKSRESASTSQSETADKKSSPSKPNSTAPPPDDKTAEALKDGNFKLAPPYADAPELKARDGVPKGTLHDFTMDSTDSKIYPGIKGPYKRKVSVYVPSQYKAGTAAPFIVSQDAMARGVLPTILDNMIDDKRLPPMIAIFIANGGGDSKGSERGLEYDTVSGKYAEFIETEVLPRIEKDCKVTLTKDPDGRAAMGGSSGGAAAFSMAWFHPDLYHRVLTYSGTYVNQQSPLNPESPHGAWEYHENLIPKSDAKPLRVWLEVGENDNGAKSDEKSYHNWVLANERMAEVFKAKNYHYRYVFAAVSGHTDRRVIHQTLPDALLWLWQGYTAK